MQHANKTPVTSNKARICLVDDHAVLREGLRLLINAQPDMTVVCEADNGRTALELVLKDPPDVLVMDVSMPGGGALDAVPAVCSAPVATRVVVLTVHEEQAYVRRLFSCGASGYVLKRSAAAELIHAIRRVIAGGTYIDPALASRFVLGSASGPPAGRSATPTERETEVIRHIARGYGNSEIAAQLNISVKTVETYKARIMEKMGFRSRADIVRYALSEGLLHHDR